MKNEKILYLMILISSLYLIGQSNMAFAAARKDVTTCNTSSPNADPTGVTDSTVAIQTCLNNAGSEVALYFPPGKYTISSTITVAQNYVTLYSDSLASARIDFTGCGDMIKFSKGGQLFNGGIRGLWLRGSGLCAQTAIHLVDISWVGIEDVKINNFYDATENSVGIQIDGREGFNLRNVFIETNNPIVIGKNPNHAYLDADHFHLENIYSIVNGSNQHWHITLNDRVTVTNMIIDGVNPMAKGCGVLKWISTTMPSSVSYHLKISGVRHEQLMADCDKQIYIDLALAKTLQGLIIDNVRFEGMSNTAPNLPNYPPFHNAIYTNNVSSITVRDTSYPNNALSTQKATFINATGAKWIQLENNYITPYGGKIITASPTLVWKEGPYGGKGCCDPNNVKTTDTGALGPP